METKKTHHLFVVNSNKKRHKFAHFRFQSDFDFNMPICVPCIRLILQTDPSKSWQNISCTVDLVYETTKAYSITSLFITPAFWLWNNIHVTANKKWNRCSKPAILILYRILSQKQLNTWNYFCKSHVLFHPDTTVAASLYN